MITCTLKTHITLSPQVFQRANVQWQPKAIFFMHTFIKGGVSVMCKAHFAEVPDHEKYQIIVNYDEEEIACFGEGLVTSITFLE